MMSGIVLAGGQSKRLGREKGLALLGGTALVNYVTRAMSGLVDEVIVSVARGRTENYRNAIFEDVRIVEDAHMHVGPLEGLISGFGAAKGEYVLVAPCDTPLLKASVCKAILEKARHTDGAVPVVNGYYEPLHGAYRRDSGLMAFDKTLKSGKRRVCDSYSFMTLAKVDEATLRKLDPALESFWNMNTEKDLIEAEKRLGRAPP